MLVFNCAVLKMEVINSSEILIATCSLLLRKLYSSPSTIRIIKSRRMTWVGHVAGIGEKRNAYRILVGKPEGKRPLARPRCRWWTILKWILER
jgi:hypothetical protein